MKKHLTYIVFFLLASFPGFSQEDNSTKSGIGISIGAAADYYYGKSSRNFSKFEDERVNWHLSGVFGLTITRDKAGKRTFLAAFGNYGFNNNHTVKFILEDQDFSTTATSQSKTNNFFTFEGGIIFSEVFRISTGVGQQNFNDQSLTHTGGMPKTRGSLKYYSTTAGFRLGLGKIVWTIDCNFNYGKDYDNTVITPSTGLMFGF